ncbi:hypothetical protein [Sphingomonas alpina]|uniref:Uncharacterized protein n=1 Tax=Sphingomonas alpina TaxID=653931 RepID=A0A7H0LH61_9SPHN|nr:hypothetical protein [Sphingomonas alpina]QNQ09014.1 hypothetical protein H3Z74_20330 [Sphingomonas alpina]
MPTSRYRVIEKDRRLFVIDTWAEGGRPVQGAPPSLPKSSGAAPVGPLKLSLPRQTRFDGSAEVTTHPFYDDRAPRTIKLDAARMQTLGQVKLGVFAASFAFALVVLTNPWFLVAPLVLLNPGLRKGVRRLLTAWLDRAERASAEH